MPSLLQKVEKNELNIEKKYFFIKQSDSKYILLTAIFVNIKRIILVSIIILFLIIYLLKSKIKNKIFAKIFNKNLMFHRYIQLSAAQVWKYIFIILDIFVSNKQLYISKDYILQCTNLPRFILLNITIICINKKCSIFRRLIGKSWIFGV